MSKRLTLGGAAAVLAVTAGMAATAEPANAQERYEVAGADVAVYNLAGEVEIVSGVGSAVVVEVMRGGADSERLAVEIGEVDGRQALRVLYPTDQVVYPRMGRGSNASVRVRRDGTFYDNRSGRGDRVEIRGGGGGLEAHADLRVHVPAGRDISVYLAVGKATATGLRSDLLLDLGSAAARVEGVEGSVTVDTGSGAVDVADVTGDLFVDTGSGAVTIRGVSGDEVTVDTGSGSIVGSDVVARSFNADTGSGRIEIDGLSAPDVFCDTGSGSVRLRLTSDVDHLEVDTGSGGVTLELPANAGAEVEVDTGSGRIDVDLPFQVERAERTYVRGRLGDGNGRIVVDTGSGGVTLRAS